MKVFTTGQVAKICKVAPRTVSKWFDSGRLKGYRIPGSQDRRIPREYLIKFLKEHGMPLGDLEGSYKTLIVSADSTLTDSLKSGLSEEFKTTVLDADACAVVASTAIEYDTVIVDMNIDDSTEVLAAIKQNTVFNGCVVIAIVDRGSDSSAIKSQVNEVFSRPFDVKLLTQRLETLV